MKTLSIILFLLFSAPIFGQSKENISTKGKDTDSLKQYIIGDRIISCSGCQIDFCGNIISSQGDTLGKNSRPVNQPDIPLYFTTQHILLNNNATKALIDRKKIKSISVFKCNEGINLFGDLAKNGIIILELKDTTISSENLLKYFQRTHPDKTLAMTNILINGLATTDEKIKYPSLDKIRFEHDTDKNIYNIKTE